MGLLSTDNTSKRILIADDHVLIRRGLTQLLLLEFPSAIVVETSDAEELLNKVFTEKWDLVITDISMPGKSGLDVLQEIKRHSPKLPVLVISMFPEEQYAIRVLKAGGSGYLNKLSAPEEMIKAINSIFNGRKYITAALAEQLAVNLETDKVKALHEYLSDREYEIFKLLATGKSVSAIAIQLSLSPSTVSTYRARIMMKMNVHTNADIIFYAIENNIA